MTTRLTALIGSLLLLLGTSACGGGDESEPSAEDQRRTKAVTAIADRFYEDNDLGDDSGALVTKDQSTCVATALVDRVGVDVLVDQAVLTSDLTVTELPDNGSKKYNRALVHGISDCIGIVDMAVRFGAVVAKMLAEGSGDGEPTLTDEEIAELMACAEEKISEAEAKKDALRELKIESGRMLSQELTDRLKTCDQALAQ